MSEKQDIQMVNSNDGDTTMITCPPSGSINLYSLATTCLASSLAASEPIRRIALEGGSGLVGRAAMSSYSSSSSSSSSSFAFAAAAASASTNGLESSRCWEEPGDSNTNAATDTDNSLFNTSASNDCGTIHYRKKVDGTIVTDADGVAQKLIVDAIRSHHPANIKIVCEESEEEENRYSSTRSLSVQEALSTTPASTTYTGNVSCDSWNCWYHHASQQIQNCLDLLPASTTTLYDDCSDPYYSVDSHRISIFVDPLDGTKSYAKGQYECVSTLVAIVLDNKPVFGVICKPFGNCHLQSLSPCFAVYGGTLLNGAFITNFPSNKNTKLPQQEQQQQNLFQPLQIPRDQPSKAIISSSRSGGIVRDICSDLHNQGMLVAAEPILVSGAGNKALRLLVPQGGEALWPFPKSGTSLWDVAAADALLSAIGGCLTDKYGNPINYSSDCTENTLGIVASNRKDLHRACIATIRKLTAATTNYEDDGCSRKQEDSSHARQKNNKL